jgi:hypothetical protein
VGQSIFLATDPRSGAGPCALVEAFLRVRVLALSLRSAATICWRISVAMESMPDHCRTTCLLALSKRLHRVLCALTVCLGRGSDLSHHDRRHPAAPDPGLIGQGLSSGGVPLGCGGIQLCLYRCGVPAIWRGARFLFGGARAGRDDETSSSKYEPVRHWTAAHSKPRG